jgi:hypothetical protein
VQVLSGERRDSLLAVGTRRSGDRLHWSFPGQIHLPTFAGHHHDISASTGLATDSGASANLLPFTFGCRRPEPA